MKRRNADCAKLRRPIKRNKISDGMSSNTLLYVKFLFLWAIVIAADFLLEFRFEFLWPFWLLLRSVHDSFKYKGLAFSILFVCIALTSDLICLFFIPVQWLFFAASTYVWVQYVWHTDKGVCLPTIILWVIFVYLEAAIRWKDSRSMPHLDLCRPFAAHCIGYPVVTLGFGFKSYVGFRIRQRKQREVAKENDFYMQLLQQALPQEEAPPLLTMDQQLQPQEKEASPVMVVHKHAQSSSATNNNISNSKLSSFLTASMSGSPVTNGHLVTSSFAPSSSSSSSSASSSPVAAVTANGIGHHSSSSKQQVNGHHQQQQQQQNHRKGEGAAASTLKSIFQQFGGSNGGSSYSKTSHSSAVAANECKNHDKDSPKPQHYDMSADKKLQNGSVHHHFEHDTMQQTEPPESCEKERKGGRKNRTRQSKSNATPESSKDNHQSAFLTNGHSSTAPDLFGSTPFLFAAAVETPVTPPPVVPVKACEACPRLESDLKKTKAELSSSRQTEADLRQKVESHATVKSCLQAKQKENDELHAKLQDQTNLRQIERQSVQTLERRLTEERRQRQSLEAQLNNERKYRKAAEEKAARPECSDSCRMKKQQLENEINKMRRDFVAYEEMKHNFEKQSQRYEQELRKMEQELRNRGEQQHSDQMNLNDLRMKNATLEKNLSAETRVKLDLFSALGASKREVELRDSQLRDRNNELLDLKAKIAQLLAVMPTDFNLAPSAAVSQASSAIFKLNDGSGNAIGQRASPLAHLSNVNSGVQGGHLGGNGTLGQLNLVNLTTPNGQPSLDPNAKTYTPKNSSLIIANHMKIQ